MIDNKNNRKIWPISFFDRFCSNEDEANSCDKKLINFDGPKQDYQDYIESIRSELTNLFNTFNVVPDDYFDDDHSDNDNNNNREQLHSRHQRKDFRYSAPFYGVRKISSLYIEGEIYQQTIEEEFEKAIKYFEPRIIEPKVYVKEIKLDNNQKVITFEVSGYVNYPNIKAQEINIFMEYMEN